MLESFDLNVKRNGKRLLRFCVVRRWWSSTTNSNKKPETNHDLLRLCLCGTGCMFRAVLNMIINYDSLVNNSYLISVTEITTLVLFVCFINLKIALIWLWNSYVLTLSFVRASLSQKLNFPSDPTVASEQKCTGWKAISFTWGKIRNSNGCMLKKWSVFLLLSSRYRSVPVWKISNIRRVHYFHPSTIHSKFEIAPNLSI